MSINDNIYKNIRSLSHQIPFYSDVLSLLDHTTINEVVETTEVVKISSNDIIDIAFVVKDDEVKDFLSNCYRRSNIFIIYYKERNHRGIRSILLIPIENWQTFH